ncbi:MAG: ArsR/SmtB family transcription factor [Gammaproteobacteria bacterium]
MSLDHAIQTLKAAGDPTRLRLLALLSEGEATVGELQEILGQSQPRVSRHLRLLDEAGLVTKFRDGHWVYYRLVAEAPQQDFARKVIDLAGARDDKVAADAAALLRVKRERERDVYASPGPPIMPGACSGLRPDAAQLGAAFVDVVGDGPLGCVLDVGCGAGTLLCLLGTRANQVSGVDVSRRMRLLARSRVHRSGIANCTVREGKPHDLPFDDAAFDLVVLDEVLGDAGNRPAVLCEAGRVLKNDGRLLIVDRVQPVARQSAPVGRQLIDDQLTVQLAALGYRVTNRSWLPGRSMEYALLLAVPANHQMRTGTDV